MVMLQNLRYRQDELPAGDLSTFIYIICMQHKYSPTPKWCFFILRDLTVNL